MIMKKSGKFMAAIGSFMALAAWPAHAEAGSICYSVCVQGAWQSEVCDGVMAGTTGQGLPIQAIRVRDTAGRNINYRAHLSNVGWLETHSGNSYPPDYGVGICGVTRVEAIEVYTPMAPDMLQRTISYWGHVQNLGDQMWRYDGQLQGTTGRSLQLEAIKMKRTDRPFNCLDTAWSWGGANFLNLSMRKTGEKSDGSPICTITGSIRTNVEGPATNFTADQSEVVWWEEYAGSMRVDLYAKVNGMSIGRLALMVEDYDYVWSAYWVPQGASIISWGAAQARRDWDCH